MQNIWLCALLRPVTPVREQQQKQHGSVQTKKRFNCKKAAMEIIKHLALLKQTSLLLFLIVNLSFNIGYNGFFFHIVNKALFLGMEKSVVAFLPTVSAITNIIWRPLFGLVATLLVKYINNIVVYGIAFVLISISIFVFTLVHQFHWMVVILVVFGLASGKLIFMRFYCIYKFLVKAISLECEHFREILTEYIRYHSNILCYYHSSKWIVKVKQLT